MARFDDYHRTAVGYHGTGLSTALRIINRVEGFRWSRRDFDWLGHGIYFWEHAPQQARDWAELRCRQLRKKKNPTADDIRFRVFLVGAAAGGLVDAWINSFGFAEPFVVAGLTGSAALGLKMLLWNAPRGALKASQAKIANKTPESGGQASG